MAKMCPMTGCKSHRGMCVHDKLMAAMGVLMMLGAALHWGLDVF